VRLLGRNDSRCSWTSCERVSQDRVVNHQADNSHDSLEESLRNVVDCVEWDVKLLPSQPGIAWCRSWSECSSDGPREVTDVPSPLQ